MGLGQIYIDLIVYQLHLFFINIIYIYILFFTYTEPGLNMGRHWKKTSFHIIFYSFFPVKCKKLFMYIMYSIKIQSKSVTLRKKAWQLISVKKSAASRVSSPVFS